MMFSLKHIEKALVVLCFRSKTKKNLRLYFFAKKKMFSDNPCAKMTKNAKKR